MLPLEQTYPLADGRTLVARAPMKSDAPACLDFLAAVSAETDFLLTGPEDLASLTLKKEEAYLASCRVNPCSDMRLGFVEGTLVAIWEVRAGDQPRTRHNGVLALSVRKPWWGLGVGSVAMTAMIAFARSTDVLKNLCLDVRADNQRAIRLYEKFGFVPTGRRKNYLSVNGQTYDMILMEMEL